MSERISSAVFDSREEAERALSELRSAGVPEGSISILGRGEGGEFSDDIAMAASATMIMKRRRMSSRVPQSARGPVPCWA